MKKKAPSKKKSKTTRKRTCPGPVRELIKGLTKKEKELVLRFGAIAKPSFNECGIQTQRYSVFQFVHGVVAVPNFKEEEENYPKELYRCFRLALQSGDGSVFRDMADAIEAVSAGLKTKGVHPTHLAAYRAANPKGSALWWGDDLIPSTQEILEKEGVPASQQGHLSNIRRAQRAKKDLGL